MMKREFQLPDIGSGMVEAEVVTWRVQVGDIVEVDDPLVEIETEKSVAEIPVPFSGTVARLGVDEGDVIEVGQVLVVIEVAGEASSDEPPAPPQVAPEPVPAPEPATTAEPAPATEPAPSKVAVKAMPSVRRLARKHGIDITTVAGSGRAESVTMADIQALIDAPAEAESPAPVPTAGDARQRMSKRRRTIAERMTAAGQEIPHISGHTEVVADRLMAAWKDAARRHGDRVPLEALAIKTLIPVLTRHPAVHAWVDGEELVSYDRMDIGIAVDTPEGLVVPVIHGADRLSLAELASRIRELAARAMARKLTPDDMAGNTFTISNLGPFVSAHTTQILAPKTTGIISIGRAKRAPVVVGDDIFAADVMPLSLTVDHRAVDGGVAARFLAELQSNLERPEQFLDD